MGFPSADVLLSPWALGVLGLVIGSFLNVVIHRLPQLLEREWLADAAGYLQDGSAIGRVLGSSPQPYHALAFALIVAGIAVSSSGGARATTAPGKA